MSEKYKIFPGGLYFATLTAVGWIDVFTRSAYCDELIKNLNFCIDKKGLHVYSFCIMPSHLHMVANMEGDLNLGDLLRDFKSFTSKKIIKLIGENNEESRREWLLYLFKYFGEKNKHNVHNQFWQQENHPFELYSDKLIEEKINYIHNNPVAARIVTEAESYVYSSTNRFTELKLSIL